MRRFVVLAPARVVSLAAALRRSKNAACNHGMIVTCMVVVIVVFSFEFNC